MLDGSIPKREVLMHFISINEVKKIHLEGVTTSI
jgi:hypothetical protein